MLLQIAANYEAEVKLRGKVKAAMTYPVVVFVMAILMCTAMLLFIVPVFANMFADARRASCRCPTRVLVGAEQRASRPSSPSCWSCSSRPRWR